MTGQPALAWLVETTAFTGFELAMESDGSLQARLQEPWALTPRETLARLGVDPASGLSAAEAAARLGRHGPNALRATRPRGLVSILYDQLASVVMLLLVAAVVVSLAFGELVEAAAIGLVVLLNTALGFVTEWRATRSMESLRRLGRTETRVRRDGRPQLIPAEQLVPGDVILIEAGDVVTADLRVLDATKLQTNEAALTGESLPVAKRSEALERDRHLAERENMLFKGTVVTRGGGEAVVVGTGLETELGRISRLVSEAEPEQTPLEKRLNALGRRLVMAMLAIAALVAAAGLVGGRGVFMSIEVAIALAIAAIPEGLPIVATIALARGMWRMARRNALVAKLSAVETLGAVSLILTDKTGTLTENLMTVSRVLLQQGTVAFTGAGLELDGQAKALDGPADLVAPGGALDEALTVGVLCNGAALETAAPGEETSTVGDPTEIALLVAGVKRGLHRATLLEQWPRRGEEPFDPARKMMATFHAAAGGVLVAVKGAPEAVLECCTEVLDGDRRRPLTGADRRDWEARSERLARDGLRVLALASRRSSVAERPYRDLCLLGVAGLEDPPRAGVKAALDECREAGIEVVMVTGDHPATALSIASVLELVKGGASADAALDARSEWRGAGSSDDIVLDTRVIARASPEQKLELITAHQGAGRIVAMLGDGVNDAPALKKADIGVAMGRRGTQVAREAAAMVLEDDNFATMVDAVRQGRVIWGNIRKFVVYLMSCNISEILIVGLATIAGAPLPLLPLQILFLNLVTDVFPALALGVGEGSPALMRRPPRPADEPIATPAHWRLVVGYGGAMAAAVLAAMWCAFEIAGFDKETAVTVSFLTLALAQLWHVFNMREADASWWRNEITRNPWVWAAIAVCLALLGMALYLPAVAKVLALRPLPWRGWLIVLGGSLLPLATAPLVRALLGEWARGTGTGHRGGSTAADRPQTD